MKMRFLALVGTAGLALTGLTGCQTVGGVDFDKVAQNAISVTSYEGSGSVAYKLDLGAAGEGRTDLKALADGKVELKQVKQQDRTHLSMNGELQYGSSKVPFQVALNEADLAVKLEGSPVALAVNGKAQAQEAAVPDAGLMGGLDLSKVDVTGLVTKYVPSLLKYMPAPKSLAVTDAKWTANGESLEGKQVHVELTGKELVETAKTGIDNLLADTEDGDALIRSLVKDVLGPDTAELKVNFAVIYVKQFLRDAADQLDQLGPVGALFNESNKLKLDFFLDKDQQIRRSSYDLKLTGLESLEGGLNGISVQGTEDRWNIGGKVQSDTIDTTNAVDLTAPGGLAHYIKTIDKDSAAYKLLMKDLKMNRKHLVLPSALGVTPGASDTPFVDGDTTLVPARFVAENLDAEVKWLEDTQQVQVQDILTGKTILFTIGSSTALVDGKPVELDNQAKAVIVGDYTFVPIRFIAEQLGATVSWDDATWTASIVRN